ncbi:mechanosensitive ion channel family protein [Methanobacterium petrolearium]|uniref:mechanosensitive ion channel family protein n=1 Tax=Methanobacterium petrolearium TaxID=710190 RepID=UPI001AE13937|nr:mechanosensitive ion channel family protein [Methanobacterium petrolearium]MBP1946279.1 small-conductance mechanosensitive channel [Methanobacterium petrolearium]
MNLNELILPMLIILIGIITGFLFEFLIIRKIREKCFETDWDGFKVVIRSLKGLSAFCFTIAAVYIALNYMVIDAAILSSINKILTILLVLLITWFVARLTSGFVNLYTQQAEGVLPSTSFFGNITKILIFAVGIMVIISFLGLSITPLLTAFGIGGIALALALEDTLSNMFAGLNVITSKEMLMGDYIMLDSGEEGYVQDITWRNTTIQSLTKNTIIIPNSKIASTIITNYHQDQKEMLVKVNIGVSYGSDLEKVEKVTVEVAREVIEELSGGDDSIDPYIRYSEFDDFSINFTVFLSVKEFVEQYRLKHVFIKRLHERYNTEGIVIPFPVRTVHMKNDGDN